MGTGGGRPRKRSHGGLAETRQDPSVSQEEDNRSQGFALRPRVSAAMFSCPTILFRHWIISCSIDSVSQRPLHIVLRRCQALAQVNFTVTLWVNLHTSKLHRSASGLWGKDCLIQASQSGCNVPQSGCNVPTGSKSFDCMLSLKHASRA